MWTDHTRSEYTDAMTDVLIAMGCSCSDKALGECEHAEKVSRLVHCVQQSMSETLRYFLTTASIGGHDGL